MSSGNPVSYHPIKRTRQKVVRTFLFWFIYLQAYCTDQVTGDRWRKSNWNSFFRSLQADCANIPWLFERSSREDRVGGIIIIKDLPWNLLVQFWWKLYMEETRHYFVYLCSHRLAAWNVNRETGLFIYTKKKKIARKGIAVVLKLLQLKIKTTQLGYSDVSKLNFSLRKWTGCISFFHKSTLLLAIAIFMHLQIFFNVFSFIVFQVFLYYII